MRIIWSDTFSDDSSLNVACVCNNCHYTSLNRWSKMGLMSHLSCDYDAFSFYRVYFSLMRSLRMISLMTSLTMMVLGLGYLVRALFHFLKIPLVVSLDYFYLVESLEYLHLFQYWNILIWSSYLNIFLLKTIHSINFIIFTLVYVCLYLAHSSLRNFFNIMLIRELCGVIRQLSSSGSRANDHLSCQPVRRNRCVHNRWLLIG